MTTAHIILAAMVKAAPFWGSAVVLTVAIWRCSRMAWGGDGE